MREGGRADWIGGRAEEVWGYNELRERERERERESIRGREGVWSQSECSLQCCALELQL